MIGTTKHEQRLLRIDVQTVNLTTEYRTVQNPRPFKTFTQKLETTSAEWGVESAGARVVSALSALARFCRCSVPSVQLLLLRRWKAVNIIGPALALLPLKIDSRGT